MNKIYIKYYSFLLICITYSFVLNGQGKKTCKDCHNSLIKHEYVHPVAEDDCENCHQSSGNIHPAGKGHEFSLAEESQDLCYICHDPKNVMKNVHSPINNGYCGMCHSPHASPNEALLTVNPVQKICYRCHELEIPETEHQHSPVKKGDCHACHDPHQSDFDYFLKDNKPQLCFNCHENVKKEASLENIHYPFDDACSNCHNSHSSKESNLMSEKTPDICFNCHDGIKESFNSSLSSHAVMFNDKNCANCHSPHASSFNTLLKNSNKELCLSCHNKKINTESGVIENLSLKIKKAKSVHAAIDFDGCATCHKAHYSDFPSLLIGNYPIKKYVDSKVENFALCFECHERGIIESEYTTDATNFRDGETNMHYIHMKGKKARSCSLCHDMHASGNEHLIHEKSKFGTWEMSMNYKLTNTGGSCFPGCHGEKSYLR